MSELKIERTTKSFEEDPQIREYVERNTKIIESLLEDIKTKLGEGKTADVHFLDSNVNLCVKVLKKQEEISDIFYNRLETEMGFLTELQGLDEDVRVPKPYFTADYDGMKFMLMETLDADNVIDIINGEGSLPENFDIEGFYGKLKNFVDKMHQKNIYHRDLHAGNVMISPKGDVYVIDFGGSSRAYGDENPYSQLGNRNSFTFTKDENHLNEVYQVLKKHMLTNKE